MKIKKPLPSGGATTPAAPTSAGGAAIADRFKLEPIENTPKKGGGTIGKTEVVIGLVGAVLALAVAGMLVYTLYTHWEALMRA